MFLHDVYFEKGKTEVLGYYTELLVFFTLSVCIETGSSNKLLLFSVERDAVAEVRQWKAAAADTAERHQSIVSSHPAEFIVIIRTSYESRWPSWTRYRDWRRRRCRRMNLRLQPCCYILLHCTVFTVLYCMLLMSAWMANKLHHIVVAFVQSQLSL